MLMNQSILVDGKELISAIRASKKVGYSGDYVGQLCRAKKIPGKLIGKTWYVDFSALIDHKRNRKLGKQKKEGIPQISSDSVNINITNNPKPLSQSDELAQKNIPISYEKENIQQLPELHKKIFSSYEKRKIKRNLKPFFAFAVPVMLLLVLLVAKTDMVPLSSATNLRVTAFVSSALDWVENLLNDRNRVEVADIGGQGENGVVVFPNDGDRLSASMRIKNIFSDKVNIDFDEEGDTGVITPAFRTEDNFEDYAFVLVPVEEKDKENVQ